MSPLTKTMTESALSGVFDSVRSVEKSAESMTRFGAAGNSMAFSVATILPLESAKETIALAVVPEPAVLEELTPVTGMAALVTFNAVPSFVMAETYFPLSAAPPDTEARVPPVTTDIALSILALTDAAVGMCSERSVQSSDTAGATTPSICLIFSFCIMKNLLG